MDDQCGSPIAEDGVVIATQRDTRGEHDCSWGALRRDREVPHISSMRAFWIFQPVLLALRIEMRSGRLETRALALRILVDVERMFSGRKVCQVQPDVYPLFCWYEFALPITWSCAFLMTTGRLGAFAAAKATRMSKSAIANSVYRLMAAFPFQVSEKKGIAP